MSIVVTNQQGTPLGIELVPHRINIRLAKRGESSDQAIDDRFTDNGGATAWPGGFVGGEQWDEATIHVNVRDADPKYGAVTQDVRLSQPIVVRLPPSGNPNPPDPPPSGQLTTFPCPTNASVKGYGTSDEWKKLAHDFVNKTMPNGIMEPLGGPQPNLAAFNRFLQSVAVPADFTRCELQNADRGEGALKPRLFMPTSDTSQNDATGKYSRIIDFGDFGFKFFHNAVSSDEWVRTPPSW